MLTTRGVAARAGTTEASVFNNFGDKNGLLKALIAERLPQVIAVHEVVSRKDINDLAGWIGDVVTAAVNFYTVVVPLSAPIWASGARLLNSEEERESLFPIHSALTQRLQLLQRAGRISEACRAEVAATLLLGSALHNALNYIASQGGEGRLVTGADAALAGAAGAYDRRSLIEALSRLFLSP